MSTENRRRHPRMPIKVTVKISHPDFGEKLVKTRNLSDSGIFLISEPGELPPTGSVIKGQVQDMIENPPVLDMEIVRVEDEGIGLQFLDSSESASSE